MLGVLSTECTIAHNDKKESGEVNCQPNRP